MIMIVTSMESASDWMMIIIEKYAEERGDIMSTAQVRSKQRDKKDNGFVGTSSCGLTAC